MGSEGISKCVKLRVVVLLRSMTAYGKRVGGVVSLRNSSMLTLVMGAKGVVPQVRGHE